MWSYRLNKIKSSNLNESIANSESLAEKQVDPTSTYTNDGKNNSVYFFTKIGHWQHLIELFIASNILAVILALAEAQSWSALNVDRLLQYMLFIDWVLLAFVALFERLHKKIQHFSFGQSLIVGFVLLQMIVLLTTLVLNGFIFFGQNFQFQHLTLQVLFDGVGLHLSYGVLIGSFCFRYLYMREQWARQQNSELNARIQAMQARIHPHFLFNSLNTVISLITIDPDKAEQMLLNLSQLFRASFKELKLVRLKDEIELCQRYLAIEQIRLGDRLHVEWKYDDEVLFSQIQIPLLTLQPLVENSIFHGVEKFLTKSTISILIEILQNQVNIVITNPYTQDKINLRQGHGIAVENVKQRLEAYYGRSATFQTYAGKGIFTTVVQYRYK
ncbi:alginate biosynthesis protein [Acinetobacter sp. ANC 4169]|uniref:sensor histidine kinase n=1 Tax=Acinetobacter sp. ANC 4169 TaxID=1977879 RepID=UPI000A33F5EC|nr:histidine kinase [Acinetobacter sp. ANC 4169]OTG69030.1 alginate biosynthesis protein [Acinetobacter sp. ANC 4169]